MIHQLRIQARYGRDVMAHVWEIERRLREHGYEPKRGSVDPRYGAQIFVWGPEGMDLDFLRPDFLPPREV